MFCYKKNTHVFKLPSAPLDNLGFVFEFVNKGLHRVDLDSALALRRGLDPKGFDGGLDLHAQRFRGQRVEGLFLAFMMFGRDA